MDFWVEVQSSVGLHLILAVVEMRVARIPTLRWEIRPPFELQLDINVPFLRS